METEVRNEPRENRKLYWLITLVSFVACVLLVMFAPEWFWLTLPFMLTFFAKALGVI